MKQKNNLKESFKYYLLENNIKLVCLDLRGTLIYSKIKPMIGNNFTDASKHLEIDRNILLEIDKKIPKIIKTKYKEETKIFDWILVSCLEFYEEVKKYKSSISSLDIEKTYSQIILKYINENKNLITDNLLALFIESVKEMDIKICIIPDGIQWREEAIVKKYFKKSYFLLDGVYSSSKLNINKLSIEFYTKLAQEFQCLENEILVIGDRYDKDISIPMKIGCKTILIGKKNLINFEIDTLKDLLKEKI